MAIVHVKVIGHYAPTYAPVLVSLVKVDADQRLLRRAQHFANVHGRGAGAGARGGACRRRRRRRDQFAARSELVAVKHVEDGAERNVNAATVLPGNLQVPAVGALNAVVGELALVRGRLQHAVDSVGRLHALGFVGRGLQHFRARLFEERAEYWPHIFLAASREHPVHALGQVGTLSARGWLQQRGRLVDLLALGAAVPPGGCPGGRGGRLCGGRL